MSQDFFQCLVCNSFFGNSWKVEKHIKLHQNNEVKTDNGGSGRRRGMLPIKKVTFFSCYVPVVKNQIDPAFLEQYSEVQAKEEPQGDGEGVVASDFLSLDYEDNGNDDTVDEIDIAHSNDVSEDMGRKPRSSRIKAAARIRRAAAVLKIPDQQDIDSEEDEDMEFVKDLLEKLPKEDDDDDFRPPTYISQQFSTTNRKRGRPFSNKTTSKTISTTRRKVGRPFGSKTLTPKLSLRPTAAKRRKKNNKRKMDDVSNWNPCEHCSKSFPIKNELYMHLYKCHQDEANMICCPVVPCGLPYINYLSLQWHLKRHTDAERIEYDLLEKLHNASLTPNTENAEESDIKNPAGGTLPCKFCLDRFETLKLLQEHLTNAHGDKSILKCTLCEDLPLEDGVTRYLAHLKSYHVERIDPFNERMAAVDREKVCTKEKRFKCDKCEAAFYFKHQFNSHIKWHEKMDKKRQEYENDPTRRFSCPVCSYKFKHKDNLRRHFTLHLENNPFVCDFPDCNKKFNSDYNLRRHKALHIESSANAQRVYCPLCPASFCRKDKLPHHLRKAHKPSDVGTNPSIGFRKPIKYQCRLPYASRVRKFRTFQDLEMEGRVKNGNTSPAIITTPVVSEATTRRSETNTEVKMEGLESTSMMEEIHLIDRIILGSDGDAIHVKGEHLSPEKVSTNYLIQSISPIPTENSSVIANFSPVTPRFTPLSKLIRSDPIFKQLSTEDPNKVKDVVAGHYNYLKQRSFVCEECGLDFTRAWTLQLHLQTQHNKTIMDQEKSMSGSIAMANGSDKPTITLMCGECAYPAKNAEDLAKHTKLSHKPKSKCPKCGIYLDSLRRVQLHILEIHGGARNFKCQFCPQTFTSAHNRRAHEKKVHNNSDKPVVKKRCPFLGCSRMLAPSSYYTHLKRHKDADFTLDPGKQEKHKCMLCGDALSCAMSLRRHIDAIHLGKPINKNRKKSQASNETRQPKQGTVVRRGPKVPSDEWFQPLLEKALGETTGNEHNQNVEASSEPKSKGTEEEGNEEGLTSILGF